MINSYYYTQRSPLVLAIRQALGPAATIREFDQRMTVQKIQTVQNPQHPIYHSTNILDNRQEDVYRENTWKQSASCKDRISGCRAIAHSETRVVVAVDNRDTVSVTG